MSGLFDQSYQPWEGRLQARPFRSIAIMTAGVVNTWRRSPVTLIVCGGLALLITCFFGIVGIFNPMPVDPAVFISLALRWGMWFPCILVVPIVASGLVANDVKHNALLMYFSKSIFRADYLLGKLMTGSALLLLPIFIGPLLALGVGLHNLGDLATTSYATQLSGVVCVCGLAAILPSVAVVMAFSSCTKRTFLAGMGWVVMFLMCESVAFVLGVLAKLKWGYLFSIHSNVVRIAFALYPAPPGGMKAATPADSGPRDAISLTISPWWSVAILAVLFFGSLAVVNWRISNAERRG